ncbi:MAG: SpoIID/LytB domain-containing protein [Clostridiales bacterium]|nr:SpoIID/LytB domain-containing protein [Clostridiales bacterium]
MYTMSVFFQKMIRKIFSLFCVLLFLTISCLIPFSRTLAEGQESQRQILHVLLRRLNITTRVDLKVHGNYTLETDQQVLALKNGSSITVALVDGNLYVYTDTLYFHSGTHLRFIRHQQAPGTENGLRLQGRENLYEGDLFLTALQDQIEPILHIHVEDYLLGVVPYEMSDSFPLEALKAQAIAARTYALNKINPERSYDLVDTTNDQVFMGNSYAHSNAAQAVQETAGLYGMYQGTMANCYYTASNGGQTELASHVWGGEDSGYLIMQDDPYDYENPESPVKKVLLAKSPVSDTDTPEGFRKAMAQEMSATLLQNGFSDLWQNLRIDSISDMALEKPMYASPSRLYTQLTVTLTYSSKKIIGTKSPEELQMQEVQQTQETFSPVPTLPPMTPSPTPFFAGPVLETSEENSLSFADFSLDSTDAPSAVSPPVATPDPYLYSDYIQVADPITLSIPLFPQAHSLMGLSINLTDNELISLSQDENHFLLSSRRFGHGVGMSQRGAQQMARGYGKTYQEILAFYYPGMDLVSLPSQPLSLPTMDQYLLATPGPTASPTPRPTLMPVTQSLEENWKMGVVTNIEDDSSLNLRSEPNTASEVVMRLYKNQQLILLPTETEPGWYHVKTDVVQGYVMQDFIQLVNP